MNARTKTNIRFNGREYANADEMPSDVRAAYDRAVDELAPLHSGARLAAKLKAKIIVNGNEFNHPGEMSVDDRHLYHEALEALFPPDIAISAAEAGGNQRQETLADHGRGEKTLIASCKSSSPKTLSLLRLGGWHNRRYNFSPYAVTCLKALTKLSISVFFPIVRRMWFGRAGNNRPT